MRLTILGTGQRAAHRRQRPVRRPRRGRRDRPSCSTSGAASHRRSRREVGATNLAGLFVGHFHADHWIDIGPLRYRFPWGEPAPRPLPVFLPPGGREKLDHLAAAIDERPGFFEPAFAITEYESGQRFEIGPYVTSRTRSGHYVPAYSMEIIGPGGERVIYAGDMGPSEMVIELARDAELLILEATLENGATDDARRGHIDTPEAIDHVARSGVAPGPARPLLVGAARDHRATSAPHPGRRSSRRVTGMVVDVEPGRRPRRSRRRTPARVPPRPLCGAAEADSRGSPGSSGRLGDRQDRLARVAAARTLIRAAIVRATPVSALRRGSGLALCHGRHADVAALADGDVQRHAAEVLELVLGREPLAAAAPEDLGLLAAVRADERGHVLDEPEDRHAHPLEHRQRLLDVERATPPGASSRARRRRPARPARASAGRRRCPAAGR